MRYLSAVILIFQFSASYACFSPTRGISFKTKDELITKTRTIVLAEVSKATPSFATNRSGTRELSGYNYKFKIIEVLRMDFNEVLRITFLGHSLGFSSLSVEYVSNDFNQHKDKSFWTNGIGRSPYYCCICGPAHNFKKGEKYLLFHDALGAMKSAEIIRSKKDKWYIYVKNNL